MSERILTRHSLRKSGKNISREKYDQVRARSSRFSGGRS